MWDLKPPSSRRTSTTDSPLPETRRTSLTGAGAGGRGGGGGGTPPVTQLKGMKEQVAAVGWSYDCGTLVSTDKAGNVAFWQCAGA